MVEEKINLTGKWIVRSQSDGVPYESGMELVHYGNRVMGLEEGGETEYFLEGEIVGSVGTVKYRGMYGEPFTGTYYFDIKDFGDWLDGHYVDDSDQARIPWEARRDRP